MTDELNEFLRANGIDPSTPIQPMTDEQIDAMIWPAPLTPEEREIVRREYEYPDGSGYSQAIRDLYDRLWERAENDG